MLNSQHFNANTLTLAAVMLLGLVLAVVVGDGVANGNYIYVGAFALIAFGLPLALRLGTNSWILIPLTMTANSRLGFLPLPLSVAEICALIAAALFCINVVMRRIHLKIALHWTDILLLANVAWLIVTFVKNPTGLFFLGSESVGGRKYIYIAFAFICYFILSRSKIPAKWAHALPIWIALGMAAPHTLQSVATVSPDLGSVISRIYVVSNPSGSEDLATRGAMGTEERVLGLEQAMLPIFLAMCAYYPPVTFISPLYPIRLAGAFVTFILVGLSGFRSALLAMGGYVVIGTFLRGTLRNLVPLAAVCALCIVALASAVQSGAPVPLTIQRALSVLPLGWDPQATKAAEDSTTWRVDMWRDAWNDPNYFRDKVFGDGFGFTHQELMIFANQMSGLQGLVGASNTYEMFIIRGSLHNGPLSSIRYGGFGGLILLTALMILTAIYAVKVVGATVGTVYTPIALFTAIPLIYEPIAFFTIFGAYDNHMIQYFLGLGMLNLINRSLPNPVDAASRSRSQATPAPAAIASPAIPLPAPRLR